MIYNEKKPFKRECWNKRRRGNIMCVECNESWKKECFESFRVCDHRLDFALGDSLKLLYKSFFLIGKIILILIRHVVQVPQPC